MSFKHANDNRINHSNTSHISKSSFSGNINKSNCANGRCSTVKPGFIRVKLIELEPPLNQIPDNVTLEPYCIVNIKELVCISSQRQQDERTSRAKIENKIKKKKKSPNHKHKKPQAPVKTASLNSRSESIELNADLKSE